MMCKIVSKQCQPLQSIAWVSASLPSMSSGLREIKKDHLQVGSLLIVLPSLVSQQYLLLAMTYPGLLSLAQTKESLWGWT